MMALETTGVTSQSLTAAAAVLPGIQAPSGGLRVHLVSAHPLAPHQLLQWQLRVGRRVAPQTAGASRRVHPAEVALLPGAHWTAAAARLPYDLRARVRRRQTERLPLRGARGAPEHHLGQRRGEGQDQQAGAPVRRHPARLQCRDNMWWWGALVR